MDGLAENGQDNPPASCRTAGGPTKAIQQIPGQIGGPGSSQQGPSVGR